MEIWFSKSILATLCIVPSFIAIPFMKFRYGVDPLGFDVRGRFQVARIPTDKPMVDARAARDRIESLLQSSS